MTDGSTAVEAPQGYEARVFRAPVEPHFAAFLLGLLGHKGEPWLTDIRARLAGDDLDVFAVAFREGAPVANVWLGSSQACPESAVLGHVFTVEEHRRRGLAGALLEAALKESDAWGGRWIRLTTGNQAAARLYSRIGFRIVLDAGEGQVAGPRWVMVRGDERGPVGEAYHRASGQWTVEPYDRSRYAGTCLLLCVVPGTAKLPLLNIEQGFHAELRMLEAYKAQGRGECRCSVLVDAANGRVHGLACRKGDSTELYAPRVDEAARRMLAASAEGA